MKYFFMPMPTLFLGHATEYGVRTAMERRKCTTVRQLELMIEFLEDHRDLALGRVRSKEARALSARLWRECAEILNAEGPARTGKEWARVWNDNKSKVRAKLISINASQRATGGGPSNAPMLTALEDRVANILGKDIGPLSGVRQDQFTTNDDNADVVLETVEGHEEHIQYLQIASSEIVINDLQTTQSEVSQFLVQPPHPASPVPSLVGQAPPSLQNSPRRTTGRIRNVRGRRREPATPAPTQSGRTALEESRAMILHIEEMRAEAALVNSQATNSFAQSFRIIAESIERFSQKYCQQQQSPQD